MKKINSRLYWTLISFKGFILWAKKKRWWRRRWYKERSTCCNEGRAEQRVTIPTHWGDDLLFLLLPLLSLFFLACLKQTFILCCWCWQIAAIEHTLGAGAGATRRVPLSVKRIKTVQKKRRNCRWLDAFRFFYCCIVLIPGADGRPIAYLIYLAISWFISHDDARSTWLDVSFSSSFFF